MSRTEIIDVYNDAGEAVGTMQRELAERENHLSSNALVFVFNAEGWVWVQLRPAGKKHFPGLWDISACGGLLSGELPLEAARRETREETGLDVELQYVETFINTFPSTGGGLDHRRLSHLYIGMSATRPKVSVEADDFKLWEPAALRADIVDHPESYVPPFVFELDKATKAYREMERGRQTK